MEKVRYQLKKKQKLNFDGKDYENEAVLPESFNKHFESFKACVKVVKEEPKKPATKAK